MSQKNKKRITSTKRIIMKQFILFLAFCGFSLVSMFLFAAKGPCDKSSNGESTRNVYASFPNPQGPEYDDIQLLIETYTIVFYPDDSCRNTNETDCSYTQGALSFEENGTSYTYQLINGEYKVIETTKLPSVKGYTRKTC